MIVNQNQKYPLQFREAYHTQFAIPSQFTPLLTYYKRSVWSAAYFLTQWEKNIGTYAAGTIHKYNQINHVQFCSSCSLGKIKSLIQKYPNLQISLSFRKAPNLPAYVLIDFMTADKALLNAEFGRKIIRSNLDELDEIWGR